MRARARKSSLLNERIYCLNKGATYIWFARVGLELCGAEDEPRSSAAPSRGRTRRRSANDAVPGKRAVCYCFYIRARSVSLVRERGRKRPRARTFRQRGGRVARQTGAAAPSPIYHAIIMYYIYIYIHKIGGSKRPRRSHTLTHGARAPTHRLIIL